MHAMTEEDREAIIKLSKDPRIGEIRSHVPRDAHVVAHTTCNSMRHLLVYNHLNPACLPDYHVDLYPIAATKA